MLSAIFLSIVISCWSSVVSADISITRDTNDLIQFPDCSPNIVDFCDKINAIPYLNDESLCICQCKSGYVMYRDPGIDSNYQYRTGEARCEWNSYNHEGCTDFKVARQSPIIIDLTSAGVESNLEASINENCLDITPYVKYPGGNNWTRVNINFTLQKTSEDKFSLEWQPDSSNRFAYQGLAMRLDVCGRNRSSNCITTKISGTYTDAEKCKRRTVDGRCCVFPFKHLGQIYYEDGIQPSGLCAVSLKFNRDQSNSELRASIEDETSSASTPTPSTIFPSSSSTVTQQISAVETSRDIFSPKSSSQPATTPSPSSPWLITSSSMSRDVSIGGPSSRDSSDSSGDFGLIIGIIVALLALLIAAVVVVVCLLSRKGKKNIRRGSVTENRINDGFDEPRYASLSENSAKNTGESSGNRVLLKSLEMPQKGPSFIAKRRHDSKNRSGPTPAIIKSGDTHFYDMVTEDVPEVGPAAIYNVPEADYSLITTLPKQKQTRNKRPPLTDDPSNHVYAVLERDNDPLKYPEPVDNDEVFVEGNPLYTTRGVQNRKTQSQPDMAGTTNKPSETTSSRNIYDVPESTDRRE